MSTIDPSSLTLVTLGVYGSTEESFFKALRDENVDTFVDVRRHRGLRGRRYRYANSTYLQKRLETMGVRYVHLKELSPTKAIRESQKRHDKNHNIQKRERSSLSDVFVEEYKKKILDNYDVERFISQLPSDTEVAALFCVEREPEACHRSLLAQRLAQSYDLEIRHIRP